LYRPRLFATVAALATAPFQLAGLHSLFESASAVNFDFCVLFGLEVFSAAQWLPLFSFEGARLLPLRRRPCQPLLR
jgi:hypothetical protein